MFQLPCVHCGYFLKDHSPSLHCLAPQQINGALVYTTKTYAPAIIDPHIQTAIKLFGGTPDSVTPDMKRLAKIINFGAMYGGHNGRMFR